MENFDQILSRRGTNTWKWDAEGKDAAFPMGTADLDFAMPACVQEAILQKVQEGVLSYAADKTYFSRAFQRFYERRHETSLAQEWIVPATSLMAMYQVALRVYTRPGDAVVVQTPVFGPLASVAKNNGRIVYENPLIFDEQTRTWTTDFDLLEEQLADERTNLLVLCNPGNPTSKAFSRAELSRICQLACANHVLILSDEIHAEIYFDGFEHTSILDVARGELDNVFVLSSAGKLFGVPGLKTGLAIIPNELLRKKYQVALSDARLDTIDLGLVANAAGYNEADDYLDELSTYLQQGKDLVVNWFAKHKIEVTLTAPQATYLFWLDFRKWGLANDELASLLKKYGVVFSSGTDFAGDCDGFVRMNIGTSHRQLLGCLDALFECYQENIR